MTEYDWIIAYLESYLDGTYLDTNERSVLAWGVDNIDVRLEEDGMLHVEVNYDTGYPYKNFLDPDWMLPDEIWTPTNKYTIIEDSVTGSSEYSVGYYNVLQVTLAIDQLSSVKPTSKILAPVVIVQLQSEWEKLEKYLELLMERGVVVCWEGNDYYIDKLYYDTHDIRLVPYRTHAVTQRILFIE